MAGSKQPTILFIDDESHVYYNFKFSYQKEFNLKYANNENKAFRILKSEKISLIVLDLKLDKTTGHFNDGFRTIENLLDKYPKIPITVLSNAKKVMYEEEVKRRGAKLFIEKNDSDVKKWRQEITMFFPIKKILLIDDDNDLHNNFLFSYKNDFQITSVTNCNEAVIELSNSHFDIILLDIILNYQHLKKGNQVFENIDILSRFKIPTIIITGANGDDGIALNRITDKQKKIVKAIFNKKSYEAAWLREIFDILYKFPVKKTRTPSKQESMYYEHGYALLIGIDYKKTGIRPLEGPPKDVKNLYHHFTDLTKAAYKKENIICITNKDATAANILAKLEDLAKKVKDDTKASVIIYYSGHGETNGKNSYLIPHDFDIDKYDANKKDFSNNQVVSSKEFAERIAEINAQKIITILDCCHSEGIPIGKGIENQDFFNDFQKEVEEIFNKKPLPEENYENTIEGRNLTDKFQSGSGRVIITSCQSNEKSYDAIDGSGGIFTNTLLNCLNGIDNNKKDGWVRLTDLIDYIPDNVEREARKYGKIQKPNFPKIENLKGNFIICAYDIQKAKNLEPIENLSLTFDTSSTSNQENIIDLINKSQYEKVFKIVKSKLGINGDLNDFIEEYTFQSNNFNKRDYRKRLITFVNNFVDS
jgi:DNA-binding response OmpR family regulator